MSRGDAFDEEMRVSTRISDACAERLLTREDAGAVSRDRGEERLRAFVRDLRAELPAAPPTEDEPALIRRLADSARSANLAAAAQATAPIEPARRVGRAPTRLALFARAAVAAALAPALLAALAFAGVELPEPAQEAFERVGIELPNQAGGDGATSPSGEAGDDGDGDGAAGRDDGESGTADQAAGAGEPQGKQKGKHKKGGPQGGPPGGDPPGHGGRPPGQGGVPPGNGGVPPGGGSGGITVPPPETGPPSVPPGQAKP